MSTSTVAPLVSIRNLSVDIVAAGSAVPAVRNVSFDIMPGDILGIVGESGSGKSVTCRAVLGLLPAAARLSGQILFQGKDLATMAESEMEKIRGRDISMIFQNPSSHLDPIMKIGAQIGEPLRQHQGISASKARAAGIRVLEDVRIAEPERRIDSYPHQLSGGMKQRAMIAAAISCGARLLLADEPTTALDVTVQARILELLKGLKESRQLSIVLVSHDLGVIAQLCNRIMVMRRGEIVEQGETSTIVADPQHEYTRLLIASQPGRRQPAVRSTATHAAPILLAVRNLVVSFPRPAGIRETLTRSDRTFRAVDEVSFEVRSGESLAIVGESGSGKSTIARSIIGLIRPSGGTLHCDGQDVTALTGDALRRFRRSAQMIFQSPYDSLNPRLAVGEAIAEPMIQHGLMTPKAARHRVGELMEMVELSPDLARRRPHELSGGQCQRIGIARALALSPRLLIADEITSALDVTIRAQILDLLRRLRDSQRLTMIYVSHDLAVVRTFCDRVAVMKGGRIVEMGEVSDVLGQPKEAYTQELLASVPKLFGADPVPVEPQHA
jgi:peptide/nickel transport system ATP-binding protein